MVEVVCAGLGRTGTLSLRAALETLGYHPCWHIEDMSRGASRSDGHLALWAELASGAAIDWRRLFAGYRATTDFPACLFYREQMSAFPQAKVVLTTRSAPSWAESILALRGHFERLSQKHEMQEGAGRRWRDAVQTLVWDRLDNARDADTLIAFFESHGRSVRRDVPAHRLLIFDVREGWGPLCAFLDLPEPSTSFPHLNERDKLGG